MSVSIDASGIRDLDLYFERFPRVAARAMSIAINETARGPALRLARRDITAQVNFPEGYLDSSRLKVTQFATDTRLEAKITGRDRPTSLARFAAPGTPITARSGGSRRGGGGVSVTVRPGSPRFMQNAFLWQFPNGGIGLALRLRPGEKVHRVQRYPVYEVKGRDGKPTGLFILYGPSVDQIFLDVADQISSEVTSELEAEFHRQFARLSGSEL